MPGTKRVRPLRAATRMEFSAHEARTDARDGALSCGFSGPDAAGRTQDLVLQSATDPDVDDGWGVYLEFDDQINSGYDLVRSCRLRRDRIAIDLRKPLERPHVDGFDVTLKLSDEAYDDVRAGLERIFEQSAGILIVA